MMSNEMKLLKAFIEASGFDIKEDGSASYDKPKVVIDYKVTKKKSQVSFDVDSPEWKGMVTFVLCEADNIKHGIDGYSDLQPMLDYFNRNS